MNNDIRFNCSLCLIDILIFHYPSFSMSVTSNKVCFASLMGGSNFTLATFPRKNWLLSKSLKLLLWQAGHEFLFNLYFHFLKKVLVE